MGETSISRIEPGDGRTTHPSYPRWEQTIPLPPDSLMWSVGGTSIEAFLVVSDAWSHLVSRYTKPACRVLDIGCGCGRTARALVKDHSVREYIGFDVIPESIEWCRNFIEPEAPRFKFFHYDLYSAEYNPGGKLYTHDFRFPCADASVDVAFACSVFTHILQPDAEHYLREIRRVLRPDGDALLSIHTDTPAGAPFAGSERRIDFAPDHFLRMCAAAGLREKGRIDDLSTQTVFILGTGAAPPAAGGIRGTLRRVFGS